ncbi:MAG TPA: phospho-sugar mutase, partial [Candidatus Sphingobacterium stercoripullorum]|nr:phospho-sugar mutase [Candidatus Sphingobacterium stercoripullorum]
KSLFDILLELYTEHGFYHEKLISLTKEGKSGSEEIEKMMENLRADSPKELFGIQVQEVRDYLNQSGENLITKEKFQLDLPQSNVLQFLTVDGDIISARPSGTEPKIKFYCSVKNKLDTIENYSKVLGELENKIKGIMQDIIKE